MSSPLEGNAVLYVGLGLQHASIPFPGLNYPQPVYIVFQEEGLTGKQ